MTLARDILDLPPLGGIDQGKSKYLPVPFHKVTNFYFNKFGALEKRSGLVAMTDAVTDGYAFANPVDAVTAAGAELVALGARAEESATAPGEAGPYLWSYSSAAGKWAPKTSVPGLSVDRLPGVRGEVDLDEQAPQVARIGTVEMAVWRIGTTCYGRIIDRATGAVLLDNTALVNNALAGPAGQYVLLACGGVFTVVYLTAANQLRRSTIHPTTLAVSTANVGAAFANPISLWDAIPTVTGKWAWAGLENAGLNVIVRRIDNATAVVDAFAVEFGRAGSTISLGFRDGYGYLLLAWDDRVDVRAKHYVESTLVTALVDWAVEPMASFLVLLGISAQIDDANRSFVLMDGTDAATNTDGFNFRAFDNFGVALMPTRRIWWLTTQCKPFRLDGGLFVTVGNAYTTAQPLGWAFGYALVNLTRHFDDVGADYPIALEGVFAPYDGYPLNRATAGALHAWVSVVDGVAILPIQVYGAGFAITATDPRAWIDVVELRSDKRTDGLWSFGYAASLLHTTGAIVAQYDGAAAVEAAFLEPPQIVGTVSANYATGAIVAAASPNVYSYLMAWEWVDAKGNVHRSRLSAPFNFDFQPSSGGDTTGSLSWSVKCSALMRRGLLLDGDVTRVRLVVYRTLANGSTYYRCAWSSTQVNNPYARTIGYTDTESDAQLLAAGRGEVYTSGGVLEWETPPAARHVQVSGGRVWLTSAEAAEVWPSSEMVGGEAPHWSPVTRITLDDATDRLVGTGWLDGLLVLFSRDRLYVVDAGAGPGDVGVPPWPRPQAIQSSGGCVSARSIVSFKDGVFYRAVDSFKILSRGREILDVGEAVRDITDAYPLTLDAALDAARERVLFLVGNDVGSARVLCYDYRHTGPDGMGSWSDWDFTEVSSLTRLAIWKNQAVASYTSQATVLLEGAGATPGWDETLGGPEWITGTVETPWIYLAALAGYQRAWRAVLELERLGGHGLQVEVFVDGEETTPVQTETWASADISALQGLPRERIVMGLKQQKCASLKLRISDLPPAVSTPERVTGFRYHRLGLEIGRKRGVEKAEKANTR